MKTPGTKLLFIVGYWFYFWLSGTLLSADDFYKNAGVFGSWLSFKFQLIRFLPRAHASPFSSSLGG